MQSNLFPADEITSVRPAIAKQVLNAGADFSECGQYRYALWRIWDETKPLVMFIGLNPSTANETENDPTIRSVERIAKANGYGGFYMMNCFPFVSTDPKQMLLCRPKSLEWNTNELWLWEVAKQCQVIVFAWGNFGVVKELGRDKDLSNLFPNAKALAVNKNGSPKHPLYCKSDTRFVEYKRP